MSEDLKVQQRPSATPYVLGGGLAGAAIGGVATQFNPVKKYVSEAPKYLSHDDFVKEAQDDFQKAINEVENAEVEDKSFVEKLKAEKANIDKIGEDWEAKKAKHIAEGQKPVPVADTEEIKNLSKELEAAKAKLAESEKALLDATPKESIVKPTRLDVLTTEIAEQEKNIKAKESVLKLKNDISDLTEKLELAKNKEYLEQRQKGLQVEIENLASEIEKLSTKLDSNPNGADLTKFENLAKDFERKSKELADLKAQKKSRAISIPKANISSDYPRLVKGMQKNEALLEEIAEQRKDLIQRLAKDPNSTELQKELSNLAKKEEGIKKAFEELKAKVYNPENLTKEMQEKLAKYNAQEKFINEKLDDYARRASQASKKEGGTERSIKQGLAQLRDDIFGVKGKDGKVVKEGLVGLSNSEKEAVFNQAKEQFNDRIALFDRIHGDELKLNELKEQYNRFTPTRRRIFDEHAEKIASDIKNSSVELDELKKMQELAKKREKHIKTMWQARKEMPGIMNKAPKDLTIAERAKLNKLGINVDDLEKGKSVYTSFKDSLNESEGKLLKKFQEKTKIRKPQVTKTTPATEGLAAAVEANNSKIKELTSQIAEKRAALPKPPVKTAEELTAEFVKDNGSKADAIKKATKDALDKFKTEFNTWVENATKTKGSKIAIAAVGTALVGALIGLALRPSKKEA